MQYSLGGRRPPVADVNRVAEGRQRDRDVALLGGDEYRKLTPRHLRTALRGGELHPARRALTSAG